MNLIGNTIFLFPTGFEFTFRDEAVDELIALDSGKFMYNTGS